MRTVVVQPEIPAAARTACDRPVALPDRALPEKEATTLWARDRAALEICELRRAAAVAAAMSRKANNSTKRGHQ